MKLRRVYETGVDEMVVDKIGVNKKRVDKMVVDEVVSSGGAPTLAGTSMFTV